MRLEFAITEKQMDDVLHRLFGAGAHRPQDPERGFLAAVFPATGASRRTLLLGQIVEPENGDVYWSRKDGLVMRHRYYSRALSVIQSLPGAGLLNVHSHPRPLTGTSPPAPSDQDLATDARELCFASRALPEGRAMAAAIVTPGGGLSLREYKFRRPRIAAEAVRSAFGPEGAKFAFAERVRVVGPGLRAIWGDPYRKPPRSVLNAAMVDSSILLWGAGGQRVLSALTIGIAGLGGVGGIVAEHLARLGVGTLILVDYDRLEDGNFNRSQGATRSEMALRIPKVEVYSRVAKEAATAPGFQVFPFRESVAESAGLNHLLDCDIVVAAADDAFARQVLDHMAYAHLIPVIDGGTTLVPDSLSMMLTAGKSQIAAAGAEHACLECQGVYSQEEATVARESATWGKYIDVETRGELVTSRQLRAPSVICNNGLVASLIGLRILAIALRVTPATLRGTQRYYVEDGTLAWGAVKGCRSDCLKASWSGQGDAHFIPVGEDIRWKKIRQQEVTDGTPP
jgi:hypothetical protein